MNVLLGRSLKYKSFKYNHIVASLKPKKPSARSSIQSEEERRFSAYLEEPVHTQKDKDVFEQFKNDVTFWKNLLISVSGYLNSSKILMMLMAFSVVCV